MKSAALICAGALVFTIAAFLAYALLPRVGHADLAVVLGGSVLDNGQPSPSLAARLDAGARAWRLGLVPLIMVSGGRGASGFSEADVMQAYLLRGGIPDSAILVDPDGVDTMATAENAARTMRRMGLHRVLVVSQYFHLPRCLVAFRKAGVERVSATYPAFVELRDV